MNKGFAQIRARLPEKISDRLSGIPESIVSQVEEIRLRCGQNVCLCSSAWEKQILYKVAQDDLFDALNCLIKYSYYAYEEDLAKGFVTIEGGHRVGICGKAVVKEGRPALIKSISSMNIRFAKEFKGCAKSVMPYVTGEDLNSQARSSAQKITQVMNTLIVSPPGCGKTTMLRDIARSLSYGGVNVSVCDERSELAGMYQGLPSFDIGPRTDVLDGCDKADGIPMLVRSMSPKVIITDEIGKAKDFEAMELCMSAGVALVTSIHGRSRRDLEQGGLSRALKNRVFSNIVYLDGAKSPGRVREVEHA